MTKYGQMLNLKSVLKYSILIKAGEKMKIEGTPKEIADLVSELQSQHILNTRKVVNEMLKDSEKPLVV